MNRRFFTYLAVMSIATFSGCNRIEFVPIVPAGDSGIDMSEITAECVADTRVDRVATKSMDELSLIDQVSTYRLEANFLRIDERVSSDHAGTYNFYKDVPFANASAVDSHTIVNWEKAYLSEATVISSPDNVEDIHYRSILFSPKLAYNIVSNKKSGTVDQFDTTKFYHTRMVGWYPRNCSLKVKDGTQRFEHTDGQDEIYTDPETNRIYKTVKFTGLNGATDVMVSNVCEGQHWHSKDPAKSPATTASDNLPYRTPFGHISDFSSTSNSFIARYSNYFKFRHYLTGVRFWGFVPDQNTHALDMWGNITDVVLLNQPTSVSVTLPEDVLYHDNGNSYSWQEEESYMNNPQYWGQAVNWGDPDNFSVQTGPMFGDDSNHSDENYTVDFSKVNMQGVGDKEHALYLGYSLVQPNCDVEVEIHTRYGVYVTKISPTYTYKYKDNNNVEQTETINIFNPGYYYDVYLSLQTDGTISAIIETRGTEHYFDLTRSVDVEVSTGETSQNVSSYKYSNCYIVDPATPSYMEDGACKYSGFFFSGMVPGNGDSGILSYNSQTFYPSSARLNPVYAQLIWESERLLVADVELVNGYVKFRVPGITDSSNYSNGKYTGTKGNAVIGVFDENDKCLWSWHVWITDSPETVSYSPSGSKIEVMDRNLGAIRATASSGAEALGTYGLYYQWGRKDPSMGPSSYNYSIADASTATYYDYASDEQTVAIPMSFNYPTLKDAVENPMYLILPVRKSDKGYNFDWLYMAPDNILWGNNPTTGTTTKTIYDPCPFGWRVSAGELEAILSNSSYNTNNSYGLTYTGNIINASGASSSLFFPYAGYKGNDKGISTLSTVWSYVGSKGDYQEGVYNTANDGTLNNRKRLYISKETSWVQPQTMGKQDYEYGSDILPVNNSHANVFMDYTSRRVATSVRCVKETEFASISLSVTADNNVTTFNPSGAVNITFDALAASSTLSSIIVTQSHKVDDKTVSTELFNINPNSPSWHKVYTFNAPSEAYLETTDGVFLFTIQATSDFGITSSRTLTLYYHSGNAIIMPSTLTLNVGASQRIGATLKEQSGQEIRYSSNKTAVLTVDEETGEVTAISTGTATVTATAAEYGEWAAISATCVVKVMDDGVITSQESAIVKKGSTVSLNASVNSGASLTYTSDDTSVATVDQNGTVTGIADGTAHITISAPATEYYTKPVDKVVTVTVTTKLVRTISLDSIPDLEVGGYESGTYGPETTLSPGKVKLGVTVTGGSVNQVVYTVDNEDVAYVENGYLIAKSAGEVTVQAKLERNDQAEEVVSAPVTTKVYWYQLVYSKSELDGDCSIVIASSDGQNPTVSNINVLSFDTGSNSSSKMAVLGSDNHGASSVKTVGSGIVKIAKGFKSVCIMDITGNNSTFVKSHYSPEYSFGYTQTSSNYNYSYSFNFSTSSQTYFGFEIEGGDYHNQGKLITTISEPKQGWTMTCDGYVNPDFNGISYYSQSSKGHCHFYKRVCTQE